MYSYNLRKLKIENLMKQVLTLQATMGSGSEEMLSSDVDTDLTAATINCATDGTLAFMGR